MVKRMEMVTGLALVFKKQLPPSPRKVLAFETEIRAPTSELARLSAGLQPMLFLVDGYSPKVNVRWQAVPVVK